MKFGFRAELLFVAAILLGLTFLYPTPVAACQCYYTPLYSTSIYQGTGDSCQNAEIDVWGNTLPQADAICLDLEQTDAGACHLSLEITSPCSGAYEVSGKMRFGCWHC